MKAKISLEELYSMIKVKVEQLHFIIREMDRHMQELDACMTGNTVFLRQLDELIGDLHQIELGK